MPTEFAELATIVNAAEELGGLNPDYSHVLHQQLKELIKDVSRSKAVAQADLAVARAEADHLISQREAARAYLGEQLGAKLGGQSVTAEEHVEALRAEVQSILSTYGGAKIQAIKELRVNQRAVAAWEGLGGSAVGGLLGLKDAKDIIDHGYGGTLYTPSNGRTLAL
jgi:ribosomal protein L7/L12